MGAVAAALGKISRDALHLASGDKRLTPTARAVRAGPVPSVDECVQWLQRIWWVTGAIPSRRQSAACPASPGIGAP